MRNVFVAALIVLVTVPLALGGMGGAKAEYAERASKVAAGDVSGHYRLGLWCEKNGLSEEARLEFERVVALSPDHAGARQALGYVRHGDRWLTREEALRQKGLVRFEGRWMLPEEKEIELLPASEKARKREAEAKARRLLKSMLKGGPKVERMAVRALAGIPDRYKVEPLAYALRYPSESVRVYAAKELGRIRDRRALRPLVFRSIVDPKRTVREAAFEAAASFEDPNLLAPYVKALASKNQAVRINAAEAVGGLGDIRGIEYLVWRLRAHGGGAQRSHIYLASQLSFIQDFDVEVAQTAFIADPMVGILQEGQVLDVRVLATERKADILERRVIRSSLRKLAGVDLGDDADAWAKWWSENKDRLLARN